MKKAKSKARLYVSAPLSQDAAVELTESQLHYLVHVMRISTHDSLLLFNGQDGEWRAHVKSITKKRCDLLIAEQTRQQDVGPDIWLAFAPVKKTRTDFIVEKATELGAMRLLPIFTENTASTRVNTKRLQAIAIESAEQCHRLDVPIIEKAQSLEALCQSWPKSRPLCVLDETGREVDNEANQAKPVLTALESLKENGTIPPIGFLTGPEGGFAPNEIDGLRQLPFAQILSLGPRILRAETAVTATFACFQAIVDQAHIDNA